MILAGLQKHSLIDYPGRVSCVLFTTGCNFQCPYCHNPELAMGHYPERISQDAVTDFLIPRQAFLDGVVITGGEPTLQPDLPELCISLGQMGFSVKLDTNGSRPDILQRLIDLGCLEYLAMDLKTAPMDYLPPLCKQPLGDAIHQSIQIIMNSGLDYEFRTTCVSPFVDEPTMHRMALAIKGADRYILQRCNPTTMLEPTHFGDTDPSLTEKELTRLQEIAAPMVGICRIR